MKKLTTEEFVEKAKKLYGDKYDYSLVNYKGTNIKVKIICPIHGVFEATPHNHLRKETCCGCTKCRREKQSKALLYSQEEFIEKAKKVHGNKYDYSLVNYINSMTKVKIKCNSCNNVFLQTPKSHLQGERCPFCFKESKGEEKIRKYLIKQNYVFEQNKHFDNLRNSYDFYLPELNLLIEYQGEQHYKPVKKFGGEKRFLRQLASDKLKADYAEKEGIELLTISYKDYKIIENILEEKIGKKERRAD